MFKLACFVILVICIITLVALAASRGRHIKNCILGCLVGGTTNIAMLCGYVLLIL